VWSAAAAIAGTRALDGAAAGATESLDIAAPATIVRRPVSEARSSTRSFWLLHTAGWSGAFLINYLAALAHGKPASYWEISLVLAVAGFVVTLGLRQLLRRLADLPFWRLIAVMLGPVLVACAVMTVAYTVAVFRWCSEEDRPRDTLGYLAYMASTLYVVMTWVGLYVGIKYQQRLRQQTEAMLAATMRAQQAQLQVLRYQLNPHFLFNTLNAISTLVLDRDTATADRMVQRLSAFLRHSLDGDPSQQVTLDQELAALDLYLGIESVRFAERLRVERDIAADCRAALVPGLLLQPLVENAVKHAVARHVDGGTLWLRARRDAGRLQLSVADDGPGPESSEPRPSGCGVGLSNTRERLRLLYGPEQSFEVARRPGGGWEVRLSLPFRLAGGVSVADAVRPVGSRSLAGSAPAGSASPVGPAVTVGSAVVVGTAVVVGAIAGAAGAIAGTSPGDATAALGEPAAGAVAKA
jgi:two-component system, LytTR family, sensor kinase